MDPRTVGIEPEYERERSLLKKYPEHDQRGDYLAKQTIQEHPRKMDKYES
jgi:hypothetical protein